MERPLTQNIKPDGQPLSIDEYEHVGGYQALRKALRNMTSNSVQEEVKAANLRGRGGAGFPTGAKWSFVPVGVDAPSRKYIISNSDEMEPGSFKDRLLMEGNPHQLVEGLIIGGYAIEADCAYIFLRWEYLKSARRLSRAIDEAYARGYLGTNILGTGYSLEMRLHTSAGRYICGEETALLNALEGKRGIPRSKPPYPQLSGLWGKPAVVNNAETLCNIPHIIAKGAGWYKGLSRSADGGTKIYGISGRVKKPGAWELPMGTKMREILEEYAGGMTEGYRLRGIIPGGASTDFLLEDNLDVEMDFDSCMKAGSRLGTGTMIILDDRTCPVALLLNLMRFFARESCGWCTPCREGLSWLAGILEAIEAGQGRRDDLEVLEAHCRLLGPGHTFCALAPGAVEPLQSALEYFRDVFEEHIEKRRCPWR
ncbi:MAG TPA: NADH-quinone oxidoreductase subunit NuoF [Syntrophales bacterium]|nr:NADH-quinone oxidoreductase subunit NuoF [Syntrophales bacterium]